MMPRIRDELDLRIVGFALAVEDLGRAIAWWRDVLGFDLISRARVDAVNAEAAIVRGAGIEIELLEAPSEDRTVKFQFQVPPRSGDEVVKLKNVEKVWTRADGRMSAGPGGAVED